ncbi:MAG: hypothetical protein VW268_03580 [Rhodospirillaceae bacterium]
MVLTAPPDMLIFEGWISARLMQIAFGGIKQAGGRLVYLDAPRDFLKASRSAK